MLLEELRFRVLQVALATGQENLCKGLSGNISARDPESGLVCVTPSQVPYETCGVDGIVVVDVNANVVEGKYKPSSETPMHTAIYRARPDVYGIVHTHSVYATTFSIINRELPAVVITMVAMAPVPVVPFRMPGSQELADAVTATMAKGKPAVLLQNHGAIVAANTVEAALGMAVYLEEGAQMALLALQAGGLNPLPDEAVAAMRIAFAKGKAL
jgi:L-fuculose-phosphate aldolase